MIAVATWNVLHRVHAENDGDAVVARWPEESERIAAITARLADRAERVIALQEVSGDQLASLRAGLPDRVIYAFRYPRVPVPRHRPSPLRDSSEHLVLVLEEPGEQLAAGAFEDAPGKGTLAVQAAGIVFVATHVSWDQRRTGQIAGLAGLGAAWPGHPTVLLGDFNADHAMVAQGLGAGFLVADLPPDALPTRPATSGPGGLRIDHVAARGADIKGVTVEAVDGLSDHNLVRADIA